MSEVKRNGYIVVHTQQGNKRSAYADSIGENVNLLSLAEMYPGVFRVQLVVGKSRAQDLADTANKEYAVSK